jgi:DNA invertase Pin-like site-specific DNA recombinase
VRDEGETASETSGARIRAAVYVRMSTDHQKYSTENQARVIGSYAEARGFEVARTYADEGKSGLSLGGRDALQRLLDDIQAGQADFSVILVYDVSRWGRFQDADESAYYEYVCKRSGVTVHFCAEQFENDGGLAATMIKGMKRVMAGEYSRELSVKVFMGQCRLIELGFRQGGIAGYGLRRLLVDEHRNAKAELARGEHKSIQTDRVVLVPGPRDEVATVRRIYSWFLSEGLTEAQIAERLGGEGTPTGWGRPWTPSVVRGILTNEKYVGDNVFNRRSFKLKQRRVSNPPAHWVCARDVFEPLVSRDLFDGVRTVIQTRRHRLSDEEMLNALRALLQQHGSLSAVIIDEAEGVPPSSAYRQRFGTLSRAYRLVGAEPRRDDAYVEINRALRAMHPQIVTKAIADIEDVGGRVRRGSRDGHFWVNDELSLALVLSRCTQTASGLLRWIVRFDPGERPDLTIAVRMEPDHASIRDYYLLPRIDTQMPHMLLQEDNGVFLDAFRFDNLDYFMELTARSPVRRAA